MEPTNLSFNWEDTVEDEIIQDFDTDEWEGWISPLNNIRIDDTWYFEGDIPNWLYQKMQYEAIQSEGNQRFNAYWEEKMKRQREGIE